MLLIIDVFCDAVLCCLILNLQKWVSYSEQIVLDMLSNALEIDDIYFYNFSSSMKLMKVLLVKQIYVQI